MMMTISAINQIAKKNAWVYGMLSFLLFSLSLMIGYNEESSNHLFVLLKAGLIAVSSISYYMVGRSYLSNRIAEQYALLSVAVFIYEIMLFFAVGKTVIYIRDYPAILNSIMWISCSFASIIHYRSRIQSFFSRLVNSKESISLVISSTLLSILVIILSIEPTGMKLAWDNDTFYNFINMLGFESLYDAKLLRFYSHISIVYSHIIVLLKLLFNDIRLAFFLINTFCIVIASFGTVFLLRELVPGKKTFDYTLGAAVFMLSPWVCGMSTYHIYDYYIWCLFPLLIYFVATHKWIWVFVLGAMITFSKATGLVVFGSVCVAIVIVDYTSTRKENTDTRSSLLKLLAKPQYWCWFSILPVFLLFFKNGVKDFIGTSSSTYFGFNPEHILQWIKMILFSNFLWLYIVICIISATIIFFLNNDVKENNTKKTVSILLISDLIFILFNFIFVTYRIPRYLDSHISIVFIIEAILLLRLNNKTIKYIGLFISVIISTVSSFYTIDPLSLMLFNSLNVGDHRVVDYEISDLASLGDSIITNRDYYSYPVILDKVLTYIISDKSDDTDIMFSLGTEPSTWGPSAGRYSYVYDENKRSFELFYDTTISGLANYYDYEYYDSNHMIPFNVRYIFPEETVDNAISQSSSKEFYYIYMPTLNYGKESQIENYNIIDEKKFSFRGWKMNCIKFNK